MTAGAANCEINWTCDPEGRNQYPAWGSECASLTFGRDKGTTQPGGTDRICGQFPRQDVSRRSWASLDLCDITADCVRRAVTLLTLVRGIILERNWIGSQIQVVKLMIIIPCWRRICRPETKEVVCQHPESVYINNTASLLWYSCWCLLMRNCNDAARESHRKKWERLETKLQVKQSTSCKVLVIKLALLHYLNSLFVRDFCNSGMYGPERDGPNVEHLKWFTLQWLLKTAGDSNIKPNIKHWQYLDE